MQLEDAVGVVDRRRHQLRRLAAGVAEHDALVAGALVLVAGGIDALGDVDRLGVQQDLDLAVLPVEALLLVADVADGGAGEILDLAEDRVGPANLAGDDDAVGGRQRLAGDARLGHGRQIGVDDGVGDAVADLVGMAFGDRFAGEQIIAARHGNAAPCMRQSCRKARRPGSSRRCSGSDRGEGQSPAIPRRGGQNARRQRHTRRQMQTMEAGRSASRSGAVLLARHGADEIDDAAAQLGVLDRGRKPC